MQTIELGLGRAAPVPHITDDLARAILEEYGVECDPGEIPGIVEDVRQQVARRPTSAEFTGGNQIDNEACTTNNACHGC